MSNVTISIDESLLKACRKYAQTHGLSLNSLIRKLLKETVDVNSNNWLDECFNITDSLNVSSHGKKWTREDLYNV